MKNLSQLLDNVRTEIINKNNTKERTYATLKEQTYPHLFYTLAPDQQRDAIQQLQTLPLLTQQNILNEWQNRCLMQEIQNKPAYLFGMLKKARYNKYRPCNIKSQSE